MKKDENDIQFDFDSIEFKDFMEQEELAEYEKDLNKIRREIIRLNSNLYILQKLSEFPYEIFYPQNTDVERIFLTSFYQNTFEVCLSIIWKVYLDNKGYQKTITINKLKNRILKNLKNRNEVKGEKFKNYLAGEFSSKTQTRELENRIILVRKKFIHHLDSLDNNEEFLSKSSFEINELQELVEIINKKFEVISLARPFRFPVNFLECDPNDINNENGLDRILDMFIKNSYKLNSPESYPLLWETENSRKIVIKNSQLEEFNFYRKKFGLKEV